MNRIMMAVLGGVVLLSGCAAHSTMRGSVAMKASDTEAHVCLGNSEVKPGDKVALFRNECTGTGGREGRGRSCQKVRLGTGEVTRLLNEHYSVVKVDSGVKFEEGAIVERL